MAKSKRKNRARRVVSTPPLQRYRYAVPVPSPLRVTIPLAAPVFGDRRTFTPDRQARPIFSLPRTLRDIRNPARIVARQNPAKRQLSQTKAVLTFADPRRIPLCIRRKVRKQVLHAFKKTGKGSARHRRPRFNEWSSISC